MRASFRKVRADKHGTMYISIPRQFAKALGLQPGQKLKIDIVSKNRLQMDKEVEKYEDLP